MKPGADGKPLPPQQKNKPKGVYCMLVNSSTRAIRPFTMLEAGTFYIVNVSFCGNLPAKAAYLSSHCGKRLAKSLKTGAPGPASQKSRALQPGACGARHDACCMLRDRHPVFIAAL
jgi:hypothetical protein